MRIFHDWEFYEDGRRVYPISVGMVAEDGRELYLVNGEMPAPLIADHPWLMANVVPYLPRRSNFAGGQYVGEALDDGHTDLKPLSFIQVAVLEFIASTPDPELWAWYGAYDHVCLAQLFGPMINLPSAIPMWTNDIRTLALWAGPRAQLEAPKHAGREHHALDDAKHDRALFSHFANRLIIEHLGE